ncbi:Transcription termination protein NusB [hydrothermal vent metagenome]|uniref:Transcription termination protein NusB n=1 Tax=hydrothermal vent metagenome TaxID=652676 RepID=A0A3B1BF49_9ZZZZ
MSGKRTRSRQLAVQAIYQWQLAGQNIKDIIQQFREDEAPNSFEDEYFSTLVRGVPTNLNDLDEALGSCLDRSIGSVDPVERAILRIGAYELSHCPEVPYRVVINEGIELAKVFGAEDGHKYINGVLDKLAKKLRQIEVN